MSSFALLMLCCASFGQCPDPLLPSIHVPTGLDLANWEEAYSALGDFDGDSDLDAVFAATAGGVYVFTNSGDGRFSDPVNLNTPGGPMVTLDLNDDGNIDLIVGAEVTRVFLGQGDGSFASPIEHATGRPHDFALVHLDEDNDLDLVFARWADQDIMAMLNNGDGSFELRDPFPAGGYPRSLAVADYDGDSHLDAVVAIGAGNDGLFVMWGEDGAVFAAPQLIPGPSPDLVVSLDFNLDGLGDLVTENGNAITLWRGSETRNLGFEVMIPLPARPTSLSAPDMNQDGLADIVIGLPDAVFDNQWPAVILDNGRQWAASHEFFAGRSPAAGDIDGDGLLDLIGSTNDAASLIVTRHRDLPFSTIETLTELTVAEVAVVDLDSDERDDLVVLESGWPSGDDAIHLYRNDGAGEFELIESMPLVEIASTEIGDVNGDGFFDLMGPTSVFSLEIIPGEADGFGQPIPVLTSYLVRDIALADFNGDGNTDIVTLHYGSNLVSIIENLGDWQFAPPVDVLAGNLPIAMAVGDLDADGDPDIAVSNEYSEAVSVIPNLGAMTFGPFRSFAVGNRPRGLAIDDLNGDELSDLVVCNSDDASVSVLLNLGELDFEPHVPYSTSNAAFDVITTDFDADGDSDVVATVAGPLVCILLNDGSGELTQRGLYTSGRSVVGAVSLSDNQPPDLVVAAFDGVRILRNQCTTPCPADLDGNATVNFNDLLWLLSFWGECDNCPGDLDDSGAVDFADLLLMLAAWGDC